MNGNAYINVHTEDYPGGEIRGQILAAPNQAPAPVTITAPEDGASVTIEGDPNTPFAPTWEMSTDPDGNEVAYVWQLALDAGFSIVVFQANTGTNAEFTTDYGTVNSLLAEAGLEVGQSITLYHRALASDGSLQAEETPGVSVTVTRGTVGVEDALVQIIHAAPGTAFETVDIYLDGELLLDDFGFRTATGFTAVAAGTHTVAIAPDDSESIDDAVASFELTVEAGVAYQAAALVEDEEDDDPEPVNLAVTEARAEAATAGNVDVHVLHASPDAGPVDILDFDDQAVLVDALTYGIFSDYLELAPGTYRVDMRPEGTVDGVVFTANLVDAAGQALTVVASGYLTPEGDEPAFTLLAVDAEGNVQTLEVATDSEEPVGLPDRFALQGNHPNPFNLQTIIRYNLPKAADVSVSVYDVLGRQVIQVELGRVAPGFGQQYRFHGTTLSSGVYLYRVTARAGDEVHTGTGRVVLAK